MITKDSFSEQRIRELHARYPRMDPQLIERQIYAFALLCRLDYTEKQFVFRGGTALHVLLPEPKRISIDIDILGRFEVDDLRALVDDRAFSRMEEDLRPGSPVPKRHFKFFYRSALGAISPYILLDVVDHPSIYPRLTRRPVQSALFEGGARR